jgi:ribosomal protein S18 acetylase RimI-like enzyme
MTTKLQNGYTARAATMDDLETAVDLMNTFSRHYLGEDEAPLEAIRNEWQSPGFNPEKNIQLVFTPEGQAVGYVEAWDTANPPVHPWVWWCVHPEHARNGVGTYLLEWAEARTRQAIPSCPEGARVAFRSGVDSVIEPSKATMLAHGMQSIRINFQMRIEMEIPPLEPVWPEGITLKVFDLERDSVAEVYRADLEAFRDHFGFVEQPFEEALQRFSYFMLAEDSYAPGLWFLAMDGSQIAGFSLCRKQSFEDPEVGWVSSLGVLRPWRKRGIGLALLQHSFVELYRRGFRKVGLGVDGQNLTGALRLYKRAGMHVHRQFELFEKELRSGKEISVETLED